MLMPFVFGHLGPVVAVRLWLCWDEGMGFLDIVFKARLDSATRVA